MTKEFIKLMLLKYKGEIEYNGDGLFMLNITAPYGFIKDKNIDKDTIMIEISFQHGSLCLSAFDGVKEMPVVLFNFGSDAFQDVANFMFDRDLIPLKVID